LSSGKRALLRAGGTDAAASETQFEITYADTLMDHLGVQPYAQYVIAPGGDRAAKDIVVTGLRLNVSL
jgi:carbohydrate-selective porin OprB